MKTSKTFSLHFWLKKKSIKKNGAMPIYARITVDGVRADVSMKRSTFLEHWRSESGRVNPRISGATSINDYLDGAYSDFLECHKQLSLEHKLITAQAIKFRYLGEDENSKTLMDLLKYHREKETIKLESGTSKNYKATEKYLQRFIEKEFKTSNIFLVQVDYHFVVNFEYFLRTAAPLLKSKPLTNNGVMKHMERFHKMINIALDFEWLIKDPFSRYRLSFVPFDRPFLTIEELQKIQELPLFDIGMKRVRDVFVFACYTGLSYIDVKLLKPKQIVLGIDGAEWIFIRRKKGNTTVKVPLLDEAKAIITRYSECILAKKNGSVLPVYSNQKSNEYLKILVAKCRIEKNVSFHVARHTFATTITLANGVPIETVSKLLGHTKLSTTQIYARVLEQKISNDVAVLKSILKLSSEKLREAT